MLTFSQISTLAMVPFVPFGLGVLLILLLLGAVLVIIAGATFSFIVRYGGALLRPLGVAAVVLLALVVYSIVPRGLSPHRPPQPPMAYPPAGMPELETHVIQPHTFTEHFLHVTEPRIVLLDDPVHYGVNTAVAASQLVAKRHADAQAPVREAATDEATEQETRPVVEPAPEAASETVDDDQAARPAWVDASPKRVGTVYRQVVSSDPYQTVDECYEMDLNDKLKETTRQYLTELVAAGTDVKSGSLPSTDRMGITLPFIRSEICTDQFVESIDASFGPMTRVHVLMEFDRSDDRILKRLWTDYARQARLAGVGAIAGSIVGLIGLAYGLLRVDTWTKGYYTKSLFIGVPAVLVSLVLLWGLLLANPDVF